MTAAVASLHNGDTVPFPTSTRTRISEISPENTDIGLSDLYIAAQVVLIWPYSSSTRRFSLLLSETDRPLSGRKQVKVTLLGGAAKATQQSHVGIGDSVKLSLKGAQWSQSEDVISTPGKRVEGDLVFRREIALEVTRQDAKLQSVRYESSGTPEMESSPQVNGVVEVGEVLAASKGRPVPQAYATPAKQFRWSGTSYADSPLDPFAEDKDFVYGRSRKRTKFARPSGEWKLVDDTDEVDIVDENLDGMLSSPLKQAEGTSLELESAPAVVQDRPVTAEVIDLVSPVDESFTKPIAVPPKSTEDVLAKTPPVAPVFVKPRTPARAHRDRLQLELDESADSEATSTPRLMPMPSPGLPLVSPLIRQFGVETGYFPPPFTNGFSELDASARPEESIDSGRRSSGDTRRLSDDSVVMLEAPPEKESKAVEPEMIEDEDMYGAPQPSRPSEPFLSSPTRARDALDVLEEFLQMSPTVPKEHFHVGDEPALDDAVRVDIPIKNVQTEQDELVEEEDDLEVTQLQPSGLPTQEPDQEEEEPVRPQSRELSLDGAAGQDQDPKAPEHVKVMQNLSTQPQRRQRAPKRLSDVAQDIHTELPSFVNEAVEALDQDRVQLMSPEQTQEDQRRTDITSPHSPTREVSHLPTPEQTQSQTQVPPQPFSSQEAMIDEPKPTQPNMSTQPLRRVSQRLGRKSVNTNISSPYFAPSRSQIPSSSPAQEESSTATSPSAEIQGSPTTRVTRSQQAVSQPHETEAESADRLSKASLDAEPVLRTGVKTALSYYPPLSSLNEHFSQLIDIIAIAVDESTKPERAKSGPKDYHTTLRLVDPSLDPTAKSRTSAQIFRPDRQALPTTHRGDVVVLRNFKVQTAKHKWILLSTNSSAWAVFSINLNAESVFDDITMSGPPIEYADGELAHLKKLAQWWQEEAEEAYAAFESKPLSPVALAKRRSDVNGTLHLATQIDGTTEQDSQDVLDSIEPPPLSPRRTRRRNNADNTANSFEETSARDTASPMSTRQQRVTKAKSKTPAVATAVEDGDHGVSTRTRSSTQPSAVADSSNANHNSSTRTTRSSAQPSPAAVVNSDAPHKSSRTTRSSAQPSSSSAAAPTATAAPKKGQKAHNANVVHELRDGLTYVDDGREKEKAAGVVHELRDGKKFVDIDDP